jgi:cystathionine gamma-synthase
MAEPDQTPRRGIGTRAVHAPEGDGGADRDGAASLSTPLVRSSAFGFSSLEALKEERGRGAAGAFYQRLGHPTLHTCERRLAALEEAEAALLFSSGMAALTAVMLAHVRAGEHVVALGQSYGGTLEALQWGAEHLGWLFDLVDARKPSSWEGAFRTNTRLFHVESPTNPTLCVVDLAHAATLAHARGARLSVDNTFASPIGQHPLASGADVVAYSATKSISGHSDLLAGAVVGSRRVLEQVWRVRTVFGAVPDPETAWLIERSVKTLPLRIDKANRNALELAHHLARHPGVASVHYPGLERHPGHEVAKRQMTMGFGAVLAFEVHGGAAAAEAVAGAFRLIRHAPSLGGVETLASLPLHTSHRQLSSEERARIGIPDGLVRLAVGIEDAEDLWADLVQALGRVPAQAGA